MEEFLLNSRERYNQEKYATTILNMFCEKPFFSYTQHLQELMRASVIILCRRKVPARKI